MNSGQILLARWTLTGTAANGLVAAPGSGATITIFDSDNMGVGPLGVGGALGIMIKRVVMSSYASHDSAASGVLFQYTADDGTNWRTAYSYTDTTAGAPNIHSVWTPWKRWRITYQNSANVLTAWDGMLVGDEFERGTV